jgi:hypothetical protein
MTANVATPIRGEATIARRGSRPEPPIVPSRMENDLTGNA